MTIRPRGEPRVVAIQTADDVDADTRGLTSPAAERFEAVAGHGALATVEGHAIAIGNTRLLEREHIPLNGLAHDAAALADEGRTIVTVAIDGKLPACSQSQTNHDRRRPRPSRRSSSLAPARSC